MPDSNPDSPKPVSLREDEPRPAPVSSGPAPIVQLVITAVIFLAVGLLIAVVVTGGGDGDGVNQADLRETVREVVGTEIAALDPVPVGEDGSVDAAALDQMIDQAVGTQVAALRPTNTPVPPTPTPIPLDVSADDDAFLGPEDAPVVIVEFSDFQCGFCGRWANDTLPRILEEFPDEVKFVYRDFPIFGEESLRAAMAAECAEEQDADAFWDMHNRLFERLASDNPEDLSEDNLVSYAEDLGLDGAELRECLASERYYEEVVRDAQTASTWGFGGTPGFVINGTVYAIGAQPFEVFAGIIRSELEAVDAEG